MTDLIIDLKAFPTTRYQGSKRKILPWIYENTRDLKFETAIDVFGGTASVSYLFKKMNKQVTFNDKLKFNYLVGKALIENNNYKLTQDDISKISIDTNFKTNFIENTFKEIYYLNHENIWLDTAVSNIVNMNHYELSILDYKKALAYYALFQSCLIKRPFNLFHRKNLYLRTNDVVRNFGNKTTWDKPFNVYFEKFSNEANNLIIKSNKKHTSLNSCVFDLDSYGYDLAYFDPPYFRKDGSNESSNYSKCYHFLEGLARYNEWETLIDYNAYNLRMHKNLMTDTTIAENPKEAFEKMLCKFKKSKIVFSYKKGGIPSIETIVKLIKKFKKNVYTVSLHYKYALNHQNSDAQKNREVLIIGI